MRKRLIMGVVLARYIPQSAGHQLSLLHWLIGFRELGWDVWIVENLTADQCRDASGNPCSPDLSVNFVRWQKFVRSYGFAGRQTLFVDGENPDLEELLHFADGADLFLNFAGQFDLWEAISGVQEKAYLDVDPGFTQTWASGYGCEMNFGPHDHHITIGSAHGRPECRIPPTGHDWIPTLPPLALSFYESWKVRHPSRVASGPWTTVTHWYGTNDVEYEGLWLRGKRDSFLPLIELPGMTSRRFVVATDLQKEWEDYSPFVSHGWTFCPPEPVCESMENYLKFILHSCGEVGVAKEGYASTLSGWLSDRSMAYLACGKPVVALDTGWKQVIGEHPGLRAFSNAEEAATAILEVEADYKTASDSALQLSAGLFEAKNVLSKLLLKVGIENNACKALAI